jgi:pantetheine-phosphate adenylyltransferase
VALPEGENVIAALVPGSFDPPTNGHLDVIERCAGLFDRVLVAVVENPSKGPMFTSEQRVSMLERCTERWGNVEVGSFSGLLVDYAAQESIDVIVKGLRAMTDFDYEFQMSQMNRHLSGIVTLFVATKAEYGYLSSSLVKQVAELGGSIDKLVPPIVAVAIAERLSND